MANKHKFESNKKYFTISIYSIVVILIGCICFRVVNNLASTISLIGELWNTIFPFFIGFLIAYMMNPVVNFFKRNVFKKLFGTKRPRLNRMCAIILTYICLVGGIAICLLFIIPQLYESLLELSKQIPDIYNDVINLITKYRRDDGNVMMQQVIATFENETLPKIMDQANQLLGNAVPLLYNISVSVVRWLFNVFIAFVISIYLTADKKRLKKGCTRFIYAVFSENRAYIAIRTCKDCHSIFSGYITGKAIDSLIIGMICFCVMNILNIPYTVLISVVIGITNMIPYFGPFIGAIPSSIILIILNPGKAVIFVLMIFLLQQFDGLILGPRILGNSTGVRPIMILFAITVGGAYFGPLGMFLGVPFFAVIQYLMNNWINYRLYQKNIKIEEEAD